MLTMLRDLNGHKGHANAALLTEVGRHPAAASDPEMLRLLHHVLLANRFWLLTVLGEPFDVEQESLAAPTFEALVARYAGTQSREDTWLANATAGDLDRTLASPLVPGGGCTVAQAFLQVSLHSHGHRAQAASRLRHVGGTPPATDFILWLATRPRPTWPSGRE
ncbi:MAG: DinB family protein [Vicinamibacterales bacterium]